MPKALHSMPQAPGNSKLYMVLSKNQIKRIRSLKHKKFRDRHGLFAVEGSKVVRELASADAHEHSRFHIHSLYATLGWLNHNRESLTGSYPVTGISEQDLEKISFLSTPNEALALVKIPEYELNPESLQAELTLVLDSVRDPGNLGTIIRIANWFGIPNIVCSPDSADLFNPKTIQSTMGSFLSVSVFYTALCPLLSYFYHETSLPVYGAFLSGVNIYTHPLESHALIVLGNESQGISEQIMPFIRTRLNIPAFSPDNKPDSLNVAQAAAIICSEFRRKRLSK